MPYKNFGIIPRQDDICVLREFFDVACHFQENAALEKFRKKKQETAYFGCKISSV
ncbi:MAG: hypothetical protein LE169_04635 [Endomicrobium sp.]|nr:hypothetical protein [Endomicrobium sp.]